MAELRVLRPSVIESVEQWMTNLTKSQTPCFLCVHKAGGDGLFELVCDAFPGTMIPPFIFNTTMNHDEIFKGNGTKTNVFTNRYEKQSTNKIFEFDSTLRIVNELLEHPYTEMINEIDPEGAEAFRKDIQTAIERIRGK